MYFYRCVSSSERMDSRGVKITLILNKGLLVCYKLLQKIATAPGCMLAKFRYLRTDRWLQGQQAINFAWVRDEIVNDQNVN